HVFLPLCLPFPIPSRCSERDAGKEQLVIRMLPLAAGEVGTQGVRYGTQLNLKLLQATVHEVRLLSRDQTLPLEEAEAVTRDNEGVAGSAESQDVLRQVVALLAFDDRFRQQLRGLFDDLDDPFLVAAQVHLVNGG